MAARQRSAKAIQADLHRQEIRDSITRLANREKALWDAKHKTHDEWERRLCEFAGAASAVCEMVTIHLNAMDKLAGWPAGQTKTPLDSASKA